ncbi:MAG: ABC transporter ATP-binding protein [Pseudomonadota bacterium]|nr:ABC transporter ATP-binding protein [Pseudomonadota bacterium]
MLAVRNINCFYGDVQVLRDVSFTLAAGEVLCLLGRNGAGKTTALKAIMGLLPVRSGQVVLEDTDLTSLLPHQVPKHGIAYVPQGRRLFANLSVAENLEIGLLPRGGGEDVRQEVLALFPALRSRLDQRSGTLSGGEQQMLSMARALCIRPRAILLDEPSEGLMPAMIARICATIGQLKSTGVATLLVEQRIEIVLATADRVVFIENGRVRDMLAIEALRSNPALLERYVGVGLSRSGGIS